MVEKGGGGKGKVKDKEKHKNNSLIPPFQKAYKGTGIGGPGREKIYPNPNPNSRNVGGEEEAPIPCVPNGAGRSPFQRVEVGGEDRGGREGKGLGLGLW